MEEKVIAILEDVCDSTEIADNKDVDLFEAGLLDSLGVVSLLFEIESRFGLSIQPTDVERSQLSTVDSIVALLRSKGVSE